MRNSSSLDWLRFMHTPNDYRVSRDTVCFLITSHNFFFRDSYLFYLSLKNSKSGQAREMVAVNSRTFCIPVKAFFKICRRFSSLQKRFKKFSGILQAWESVSGSLQAFSRLGEAF